MDRATVFYCPGVKGLCVGFVSASINGKRKKRDREGHQRSGAAKGEVRYEKKTRQKVRDAANGSSTWHADDDLIGTTCRTQTTIVQNVRKKPSEDLAASVFSASERRTAAEIMFWPRTFLLGCLLMCVDIGELHPQSSLSPLLSTIFDYISQSLS